MNNGITLSQVKRRFEENNITYEVIPLQNNFKIVISQYGGRIFGPFLGEDGESILWINKCFDQEKDFKEFVESGNWNLGGDRIWLAPELQYNVKDRNRFFESYALPEQIDPGNYELEKLKSEECVLRQDMRLTVNECVSCEKELYIERKISQVKDPLYKLDKYKEMMKGVLFAGFEHEISLNEKCSDDIMSETWNLTQVNPGGEILILCTPAVEYTDYYEPIDKHFQTIYPEHVRLKITGDRRYKVGYKAAGVLGRIGYYNRIKDGEAYLLIRSFFNNPSAPYTKEPVLFY